MPTSSGLLRQAINYGFAATPAVAASVAVPCLAQNFQFFSTAYADADTGADLVASPQSPKSALLKAGTVGHILETFRPWNVVTIGLKNVTFSYAFSFNAYMLTLLNHETLALQCEQEGREPPAPPPLPPPLPPLYTGLFYMCRELSVQLIRRTLEWRMKERLGSRRAEPFLRDPRAWIRDVLSREPAVPLARRYYRYAFAILHAQACYYAADCIVSVALHTYSAFRPHLRHLKPRKRVEYVAKGALLHTVRCLVTLMAVSLGGSLCALVDPSWGTLAGTVLTDYGVTLGVSTVLHSALQV